MDFAGEFETHITIAGTLAKMEPALLAFSEQHGCKYLHIVLARGENPSQPMLTRTGKGTLASELSYARALSDQLCEQGFAVVRVKIEANTANADVPQTDDEAQALHPARYFEHHVKLVLNHERELGEITRVAERHSAHLSRNARKILSDGAQERFVTQRCFGQGRASAAVAWHGLVVALNQAGCVIDSIEREYVVFDSNLACDAGWITASPTCAAEDPSQAARRSDGP